MDARILQSVRHALFSIHPINGAVHCISFWWGKIVI